MATIICVDGLGGHPKTTFGFLKKELVRQGHEVILLDTSGVRSHQDRIQLVLNEYYRHSGKVFFVGQSAGGGAVRVAAEWLSKKKSPVAGVIQLSPSVPRGILFMTAPLWSVMKKRLWDLIRGNLVKTTGEEYKTLVGYVAPELRDEVYESRTPISCVEARELALYPAKFQGYGFPTLHIYGDRDPWISPKAQGRLNLQMSKYSTVTTHVVKGGGHLTLASDSRIKMSISILHWIGSKC